MSCEAQGSYQSAKYHLGSGFSIEVVSRSHINQQIQLAGFDLPGGEGDIRLVMLCPVQELRAYLDSAASIHCSNYLCVTVVVYDDSNKSNHI